MATPWRWQPSRTISFVLSRAETSRMCASCRRSRQASAYAKPPLQELRRARGYGVAGGLQEARRVSPRIAAIRLTVGFARKGTECRLSVSPCCHLADAGAGGRKASPPGMRLRSQSLAVPSALAVVKFVPLGENRIDKRAS